MSWFARFRAFWHPHRHRHHHHHYRHVWRFCYVQTRGTRMAVVTSIALVAGGPAVHVTVMDQNLEPLAPADLSWAIPDGTVTITPDATGFEFAAPADAAVATFELAATYAGPRAAAGPVVGAPLTVNVVVAVTALQYTSP